MPELDHGAIESHVQRCKVNVVLVNVVKQEHVVRRSTPASVIFSTRHGRFIAVVVPLSGVLSALSRMG
ncbi:MAG: hypothetical protein QF735_08975 [Phycisphaeraceae bacterium]|nr:hypothetical protein [Phycisphaeraceae bacterium]